MPVPTELDAGLMPDGDGFVKQARSVGVDASLRWLLLIFFGGLILVIGLRFFFANLQEELRQRSANERARLFIGEEIVRSIHGIEKDLYQMASTSNPAGVRLLHQSIHRHSGKLRNDLSVLANGGTVRREIQLNIEGRDEMIREVSYEPPRGEQGYVMELIEIAPLLEQIAERTDELQRFLDQRWVALENNDPRAFFKIEEHLAGFMKHLPPHFKRLDENANRLFFDSSENLNRLEAALLVQRQRLSQLEMGLVALIVVFASLGGWFVLRRIRLANAAREQSLRDAQTAREAAERASRTKSDFVSRMSHELRTPLNAIIGFAQLLESEPLHDSQKQYVSLINSSGNHLMELINAVLDHAKIEAGSLTLEKIAYDFPATIEAVRSIVLERASAKGLAFVAVVSDDLPRRLMGDPTRLRQVLINLLVNAVKFTEHGSVELRVAQDEGQLIFSVRDTGIGMDAAALSRLFQPFSQADETITRKYGGTGLGLLISKELIEAMGGRIEVDSQPGAGTCFWIRLPFQLADAGTIAASGRASASDVSLAGLIGGRVLLVDDNRVNQQLGSAILERMGIGHDVAVNGQEALDFIAVNNYALALMDMEMPVMDGLAATRALRELEKARGKGRRLTVIAMTANALTEHRERCREAGMDGFVSKPVSLAALQDEIRRLFDVAGADTPAGANDETVRMQAETALAFDRAEVLEMLGDEELFEQLAGMFVEELPAHLEQLDAAAASEKWSDLARSAHTLKGLFGTFAARAAEVEARQLEHAASAGEKEMTLELLPSVKSHARKLADALQRR